eukprot:13233-Heterococcus_DN1.PRE.1
MLVCRSSEQGSGNNGSSEQVQDDELHESDAPLSTSRSERSTLGNSILAGQGSVAGSERRAFVTQ